MDTKAMLPRAAIHAGNSPYPLSDWLFWRSRSSANFRSSSAEALTTYWIGWIIDLGEFLRQVQVIPADDAILDEPFAGFGHLLVLLLRLQEFTWIVDRDRACEGVNKLFSFRRIKG
jgi:hypothetical protein